MDGNGGGDMMEESLFTVVGIRETENPLPKKRKRGGKVPLVSLVVVGLLILGCLCAECVMTKDPTYLDLQNNIHAPNGEFLFGTDTLGRDIFSCVWYGGRISLTIGFVSTLIATVIAVVYGSLSGIAPDWLDTLMMRLTEIFLSVPSLLVVIFLQAILGAPNVASISLVVGVTGWCGMAKVVRTEVRRIRSSEYVVASRCMGGGFFHILRWHLAPHFVSSIMFMVVMNIRSAIGAESTLSFMGMGLPIEIISWGSMLSLADRALTTRAWWMILIPGAFLLTLLMCMTNIGNFLREGVNRKQSNLC